MEVYRVGQARDATISIQRVYTLLSLNRSVNQTHLTYSTDLSFRTHTLSHLHVPIVLRGRQHPLPCCSSAATAAPDQCWDPILQRAHRPGARQRQRPIVFAVGVEEGNCAVPRGALQAGGGQRDERRSSGMGWVGGQDGEGVDLSL